VQGNTASKWCPSRAEHVKGRNKGKCQANKKGRNKKNRRKDLKAGSGNQGSIIMGNAAKKIKKLHRK